MIPLENKLTEFLIVASFIDGYMFIALDDSIRTSYLNNLKVNSGVEIEPLSYRTDWEVQCLHL